MAPNLCIQDVVVWEAENIILCYPEKLGGNIICSKKPVASEPRIQ